MFKFLGSLVKKVVVASVVVVKVVVKTAVKVVKKVVTEVVKRIDWDQVIIFVKEWLFRVLAPV